MPTRHVVIQQGCGGQNNRRFALRLLAVTSPERVPGAPELPTVRESGVTGPFEVNGWYGIGAPAGISTALVERLNQDINRVLKLPDAGERSTLPVGGTSAQFGELVRGELEKWRRILRQAAIVLDTR